MDRGRALTALVVGVLAGFVVVAAVSPPDPYSQLYGLAFALPVTVPLAYFLLGVRRRRV